MFRLSDRLQVSTKIYQVKYKNRKYDKTHHNNVLSIRIIRITCKSDQVQLSKNPCDAIDTSVRTAPQDSKIIFFVSLCNTLCNRLILPKYICIQGSNTFLFSIRSYKSCVSPNNIFFDKFKYRKHDFYR